MATQPTRFKDPQGRNRTRLVKMSDDVNSAGNRTMYGSIGRTIGAGFNNLFNNDKELARKKLSSNGNYFFNPETGELEDYDEKIHYIDENYEGKTAPNEGRYIDTTQSGFGMLGQLLGLNSRNQQYFGVPKGELTPNQEYINQFPASNPNYKPSGPQTAKPLPTNGPAQSIRASSQMPQAPLRNPLSIEARLGYTPYDTLTKGSTLGMNTGLDPIKPLDGSSLYSEQGYGMNSNQPAGQLNYAGLASMPRDSEMKTSTGQPNQSAYNSFQSLPPVRNTSAKNFDEYINQSLQDPNSSINAGLANMRAQNQSRMQNTRMNALAESVDPSATTMPMSASPFASDDFRKRLSSPYSGPADSRSIAQSAREVADNNYADLTRRSLGMDKELKARTGRAVVENTLGRLETASNAVRNLGARAPVNSNSQWGNAGSPSVTQSPLAWNDGSLSSQAPMASRTQTTLNNATTIGTGSGRRMLTPEEELEAQMEMYQRGIPQGKSTRPQFPY